MTDECLQKPLSSSPGVATQRQQQDRPDVAFAWGPLLSLQHRGSFQSPSWRKGPTKTVWHDWISWFCTDPRWHWWHCYVTVDIFFSWSLHPLWDGACWDGKRGFTQPGSAHFPLYLVLSVLKGNLENLPGPDCSQCQWDNWHVSVSLIRNRSACICVHVWVMHIIYGRDVSV